LFFEPITTRGVNSEACRIVVPKSAVTALVDALHDLSTRSLGAAAAAA
jgi:hypothetical protein